MSSTQITLLILTGFAAGVSAGVFGIGGGIILVSILVMAFGYTQQAANGTSLVALLAPVGIMGVVAYYRAGKIGPEHIRAGFLIAIGLAAGTYFGAQIAVHLSADKLRKLFAVLMVAMGVRMWFGK